MGQFDWLLSSLSFLEIDSQTIWSLMGETKIQETIEGKTMNVLALILLILLEGACRCLPNENIVMFHQSHTIKEIS